MSNELSKELFIRNSLVPFLIALLHLRLSELMTFCVQHNGCKWKGGKLRLEKAKEHYLTRLKREWEQEAAAAAQEAAAKDNVEKQDKPKLDKAALDGSKINLYFPKLRKVSICLSQYCSCELISDKFSHNVSQ